MIVFLVVISIDALYNQFARANKQRMELAVAKR